MSAVHYSGALTVPRRGSAVLMIAAGWAACCSGPRARRIREEGRGTRDREAVTCRRCLALMAAADEHDRRLAAAREPDACLRCGADADGELCAACAELPPDPPLSEMERAWARRVSREALEEER